MKVTINDIVGDTTPNIEFLYQLLDRHKSDCQYFLEKGNRNEDNLWGKTVERHIANMYCLYDFLAEKAEKPEWLTKEDIDKFKLLMMFSVGDFILYNGEIKKLVSTEVLTSYPRVNQVYKFHSLKVSFDDGSTAVLSSDLHSIKKIKTMYTVNIIADVNTSVYQELPGIGRRDLVIDDISILADRTVCYRARIAAPKETDKELYCYLPESEFGYTWFLTE